MRIFGQSELLKRTVAAMEEDLPIEHRLISRQIEGAQKKVEGHNYDIRKHLLEYDDAMNQQRKVVYSWRKEVLSSSDLKPMVMDMAEEIAQEIADDFFPGGKLRKNEQGLPSLDEKALNDAISSTFQTLTQFKEKDIIPFSGLGLVKLIRQNAETWYDLKKKEMGQETLRQIERMVVLTTIDHLWKDHLLAMDHLREGIGLQGYAQKDPLVQYKKEGFRFFKMMIGQINGDVIRKLYAVKLAPTLEEDLRREEESIWHETATQQPSVDGGSAFSNLAVANAPVVGRPQNKVQYRVGPDGNLVPVTETATAGPQVAPPAPGKAPQAPSPAVDLLAGRGPRRDIRMNLGPAGTVGGGASMQSEFASAGRNDPCPCGSGKKYKKCHGANL
jgi:preprotein translocase subunit SecA